MLRIAVTVLSTVASAAIIEPDIRGGPPGPANLTELECAVHLYALEYGKKLIPSLSVQGVKDIYDALNLGLCGMQVRQLADELLLVEPSDRLVRPSANGAVQFFVAPGGDDKALGSLSAPFATLAHARNAVRATGKGKGGVVYMRKGKYYLNETLTLTKEDNDLTIQAYNDERVVISGGKSLRGAEWKCAKSDCKILQTAVRLPNPDCAGESCGSEADTDFAGNDLSATKADSPAECCAKCQAFSGCKAWTIENKDIKGSRCWLKSSDAGRRSYAHHVSGKLGAAPTPPSPPPSPSDFGAPPEIVNQLFVDGVRQVRARYPNANPQHGDGKCFSKTQHPVEGCAAWLTPEKVSGQLPAGNVVGKMSGGPNRGDSPTQGCGKECEDYGSFQYTIYDPPAGHPVYNKPLPGLGWSNNSLFSFWGSPFSRPAEVQAPALPRSWAKPGTGVLHMFHGGLWGGWMFRIKDRQGNNLKLGYGGYQEARGSSNGKHFYVENLQEELDVPQEWFYDEDNGVLLLYPNGTATTTKDLQQADVVVPLLDSVVSIQGAAGITLSGLEFTETRATFLSQYEVPSGGDWSIHRGGAVFVEDSENIKVVECSFNQTGGNGIFFSNNVTDSSISDSEFVQVGDSAVAFVGKTNGVDATEPTYPNRNTVARNHIHEYGVYGKQTSCFFQSVSANTTLENNICYNGPRAGINFNDGFGGGNLMRGNLLFNHVRETGDHGPFNSWDRQPYLTRNGVNDGFPSSVKLNLEDVSIVKAQCHIENNFIINGYNGVWTIDHDDGSQYYNDTSNVLVFGGCKNYRGHSKSCDHNLIIFPGIPDRASGARRCQTDDNGIFADQYFHNNECITGDGVAYSFGRCNPKDLDKKGGTVYQTAQNSFFAPDAKFEEDCGNKYDLKAWQALKQDIGSTVANIPSVEAIIGMARKKLDGPTDLFV